MAEYQVLARKYRPQTFKDVLGQDAIVTTLKNAIKRNSLAHAYLFCGLRGTGKTTLARLFAKALNCLNPSEDYEPCNQCVSCKEITSGHSMDVLEIDGASHRGIDDIRQINDTVGYATASGKYKIFIIDEVHMLTKEAFNALLKTLEEPPPKVMFFFATTEPHKVLPTILSRCQRYNLNRIPMADIVMKLQQIARDMSVTVEEDALRIIAARADGGLRDAESLFDQILAFHGKEVTAKSVGDVLGIMPRDSFFELDKAGKEGNLSIAFDIADQVFAQGKDVVHFIDHLTEHYRNILLIKLSGKSAPFMTLSDVERGRYEISAKLYSQEQCLTILDYLIEAHNQRWTAFGRIALETILLRILRTFQRIPVDFLVRRLAELEQSIGAASSAMPSPHLPAQRIEVSQPTNSVQPKVVELPKKVERSASESISIDPTPSKADLGIREKPKASETKTVVKEKAVPVILESVKTAEEVLNISPQQKSRYDTVLQFAAVELEGTIQRKQQRGV